MFKFFVRLMFSRIELKDRRRRMGLHDRGRLSILSQLFELCVVVFCLAACCEVRGYTLKRLLELIVLHDYVCLSV